MSTQFMPKHYINVAYKDRDMAKRLGARWDPSVKRWYCPPGSALSKIYSWRKSSNGNGANYALNMADTHIATDREPSPLPADPISYTPPRQMCWLA